MVRTVSPTTVRRLAITRQCLAGPRLTPDKLGILQLVRDLGYLQLDPISVVAKSHLLVLRSRLGNFEPAHLETLLWQDRTLFEYWAHGASIVPTEDYALHQHLMRNYAKGDSAWDRRVRTWIKNNDALRRRILARLRHEGALPSRAFEEEGKNPHAWVSTGWTSGRNVSRMLDFLWLQGKIMVTRRSGLQKIWDLSERCLPDWTPRERLSERELVRHAAERSLRALGVATARQIQQYYVCGRYKSHPSALQELEKDGSIQRIQVASNGAAWPGVWYIHREEASLLDRLERGWEPRTTLLSPFDNLIWDRARTRMLFGFDYHMEIYVPQAKRKYGYYVLPILSGDRLIGRIDPAMDREHDRLVINSVYAEPDAPRGHAARRAVAQAVRELAQFLGAQEIVSGHLVPKEWKAELG